MVRTVIPAGDLYLDIGGPPETSGLPVTRMLVNSSKLVAASTVLATAIAETSRFNAGAPRQIPIISLSDKKPAAIAFLVRVLHTSPGATEMYEVLDKKPVDEVYDFVVALNKYGCMGVIHMLQQHPRALPPSSGQVLNTALSKMQLSCIAHRLGYAGTYEAMVRDLTLTYNKSALIDAFACVNSHLLPHDFISNIAAEQYFLVDEVIAMLKKIMGTLGNEGEPVIPSDYRITHFCNTDDERYDCAQEHHDIFTARLSKVSLYPIPEPKDIEIPVKELYSHVRSALRDEATKNGGQACASYGTDGDSWIDFEWENNYFPMPWDPAYCVFITKSKLLPLQAGEIPEGYTTEL